MKLPLLVLLGLVFTVITSSAADLRVAHQYQDHMVLQRQMPVPIWGWVDPNKTVTVKIGDKSATATADANGYWCAKLPDMEANATGQEVSISDGTKTITLKDVLIGEVWICAGQSNMARSVKGEFIENPEVKEQDKDADYPLVRFINYPAAPSDTPLTEMDPILDGKAVWQVVGPSTFDSSMVLGFYFGRDLQKELKVPVGMVQIAVAGTTQTAWASKEVLDANKAEGKRTYTYDDCFAYSETGLAAGKETYKSFAEFKTQETAWRAAPTGRWPGSGQAIINYPTVLYNGLVHPLAPIAVRGMVWHQGEAGPPTLYAQRMVAMLDEWRKLYGTDFWFIYGTMTRFTKTGPPFGTGVEFLRGGINEQFLRAQEMFGDKGKGVLVPMLDLGNVATHWQRKPEAGRRMALAAMDHVYGKPSEYSGPQFIEGKIDGSTVTCKFSHVGTGLKYEPSIDGISGFVLQGKKDSVWATPKIQGTDTLVFSDPAVPDPVNVYYAMASNPHETLFNSDGLTAYSFRVAGKDGPVPKEKGDIELVVPGTLSDPKADIHVSDVRRYAYVVGFENWHATAGPNQAKCYIPKEWAKPAAQQDGKDVPLGDLTPDAQGHRFATVTAETNGSPVVLYDAAHPEALAAANLKRY